MKKNMGSPDRIIRLVIAAIFAVLYFTQTVTGIFAVVLLLIAIIFALTGLVSFCPLYTLFGISTCPTKKQS